LIISELQGGDNDRISCSTPRSRRPFRAHHRHPTIGGSTIYARRRVTIWNYRRHYVPSNATLVVVGAVDAGQCAARRSISDRSVRRADRARGRGAAASRW
jgi:hypothetical protein